MGFTRKHEREIMESEEGQSLYERWRSKVRDNTDSPEFATFQGFYEWAMESGFSIGAQLHRRQADEPYNPDNCVWIAKEKRFRTRDVEFEMKWNNTVNRIRRYYGLEPFLTNADTSPTEVEDCD